MSPLSVAIVARVMAYLRCGLTSMLDDRHAVHSDGLECSVVRLAAVRHGGDRVDDIHPGRDLAKDRVRVGAFEGAASLVIEDDEELRALRIRRLRASHRDDPAAVRLSDRLVRDRVAGAAAAGSFRVATL